MTLEEHNELLGQLIGEEVTPAKISTIVTSLQNDYKEMINTQNTLQTDLDFQTKEANTYARSNSQLLSQLGIQKAKPFQKTEDNGGEGNEPPQKYSYEDIFRD